MPSSKKRCKDHEHTSCNSCKKPSRKFPVRSRKCSKKNSEQNLVRGSRRSCCFELVLRRKVVMPCQKFKGKNTIMHILHSDFLCVFPVIVVHFLWFSYPISGISSGSTHQEHDSSRPPTLHLKGFPKPLRAKCRAAPWICTLNVHEMRVVHRIFVNVVWISCLRLIWCVFLRSLRMCSI